MTTPTPIRPAETAPQAVPAHPVPGHPATRRALATLRARLAERRRQRALRRDYRLMLDLPDHILRDIGLTRGQVVHAVRLPLSHAADAELSRMVEQSRAA